MTSNCHMPVATKWPHAWRRSSYHPTTHHDHAHGCASEREGRRVDRHAHLSARPPPRSLAVHMGKREPGRGRQQGEAARMGMTVVCPSLAVPPARPCPLAIPPAHHPHACPAPPPPLPFSPTYLPTSHGQPPCVPVHPRILPSPQPEHPTRILPPNARAWPSHGHVHP